MRALARHLVASDASRLALLVSSGCVLFVAVSTAGSWDDPYGPNDWAFSHVHLANIGVEKGHLPVNPEMLEEHAFARTRADFQEQAGFDVMTAYANTAWHFWNALPLHPAFVATAAAATGLAPETIVRLPVAGVATVLLVSASALLIASRGRMRPVGVALAPFLAALGCAPLALDLRVTMPSITLLMLVFLLHALLRRVIADDRLALPLALAPLALLPFWYYTMSYFAMLLFAGFFAFAALARLLRGRVDARTSVPLWVCAAVPLFLACALFSTGTLGSQVNMAQIMMEGASDGTGGADYTSHLNRLPWRSGLLYAQLAALFVPLGFLTVGVAYRLLRRRPVEPESAIFAQWSVGGALFGALLVPTVGISFLNRSVIYLAPVAVLAAAWILGRAFESRRPLHAALVGLALCAVATPLFVATAMPSYGEDDRQAFRWMEESVPRGPSIYSSLEVASVLLRAHGFTDVNAFQPSLPLLDALWYGADPDRMVPYLSTFDYLVLRDDVKTVGFEEFGPARQPVAEASYDKFARSRDLQLVFDNGGVQVFRVALDPARLDVRDASLGEDPTAGEP